MGYRSTVRISTSEEGYVYMLETIARYNELLEVSWPLVGTMKDGTICTFDFIERVENGVIAGFDGVKWYDSYKDVQAIEHALEDMDAKGFPWCFVRLGEDHDDIEERDGGNAFDADIPHVHADPSWNWW